METRVLVAYGSKHGATAQIAEKIGAVLRSAGLSADVVPAEAVSDLTPYGAFVIGSAVYIGRWRKGPSRLLEHNLPRLVGTPVWLFSSGPLGDGDPLALTDGWRFPVKLKPIIDRISPRGIAVFHGAVDPGKLTMVERWLLQNTDSPVGDFRDWGAIASWANGIAATLRGLGFVDERLAAPA